MLAIKGKGQKSNRKAGVAAVDRALSILDAFEPGVESLTLAELAERTGLYKSTSLRLIDSLSERGYLAQHTDGRYRIGPSALRIANSYRSSTQLRHLIMPSLEKLVDKTRESASFYVREGDVRVCLYRVDSPRAIRDHIVPGNVLTLHQGAGGKVLLAFNGESGKEFDLIRNSGFAVSMGERDAETAAAACPVFSANESPLGALSLSGPISRFRKAAVSMMECTLRRAAYDLSRSLGSDAAVLKPK